MRTVDLIEKRDGGKLTTEEIAYLIRGYVSGDIPDYQVFSSGDGNLLQRDEYS